MCQFVMLGAKTEPYRLRDIFSTSTHDFDTHVAPDPRSLAWFSATDSVLTEPLDDRPESNPRRATPAYAFRRALAEAARRFGSVQLLTCVGSRPEVQAVPITRRTTTLGQFLRSNQIKIDGLLRIIA